MKYIKKITAAALSVLLLGSLAAPAILPITATTPPLKCLTRPIKLHKAAIK